MTKADDDYIIGITETFYDNHNINAELVDNLEVEQRPLFKT